MQATSVSGMPALGFHHLRARLVADHALEVAHHRRIGMRTRHRADAVEGRLAGRDPVAHRLVHRVLERRGARLHRPHLGAQHLHAHHVGRLALDVDRAHEDHAGNVEQRAGRRRGDAVLARARLGDHARLAHALGQQHLAQHVVDLVAAGVVQLVALEIDLGAAQLLGQALGVIERARPAGIVLQQRVELALELRIGLGRRCRPSPARGSAASGFRRRSGRRKCRNARARRGRCGSCWAMLGSGITVPVGRRGLSSPDRGRSKALALLFLGRLLLGLGSGLGLGRRGLALPQAWRRRRDAAGASSTSTITSISTGMPRGSEPMPTAERACRPRSPNTSTNRSEQPLITSGCSPNSGVALTMPSTLTMRFTRSRSPSSAFITAIRLRPVSRAYS